MSCSKPIGYSKNISDIIFVSLTTECDYLSAKPVEKKTMCMVVVMKNS